MHSSRAYPGRRASGRADAENRKRGVADCASLPWGVFAMHGMRDPQAQAEASALLTQRWKECHEGRE
ncbi:MAG: hypothetical protein ACLR7Z_01220 [Bilophila wadsworthia]